MNDEKIFKILIGILVIFQILDGIFTTYGIQHGYPEANPIILFLLKHYSIIVIIFVFKIVSIGILFVLYKYRNKFLQNYSTQVNYILAFVTGWGANMIMTWMGTLI